MLTLVTLLVAAAVDHKGVSPFAASRSYGYDESGNVTSRTYPDATAVTYAYDDDGRLASVTNGTEVTSYGYDAAGNLTRETLPAANGHVETRAYDRAGRLAEVKHAKGTTVLNVATYTLDPVGNPTQVVRASGTETYVYDPLDRLTEVCFEASCPLSSDPFIRWTYDEVGNRGEYLDAGPGLYHLRARQYDPVVGRFTAIDPAAPALTDPYVSAYAYVNARPTVLVDPSGQFGVFGAVVGGVVGGFAGGFQAALTGEGWKANPIGTAPATAPAAAPVPALARMLNCSPKEQMRLLRPARSC